jgi:hypothetical protein
MNCHSSAWITCRRFSAVPPSVSLLSGAMHIKVELIRLTLQQEQSLQLVEQLQVLHELGEITLT